MMLLCLLSCELILSFFYSSIESFIFWGVIIIDLFRFFFRLFLNWISRLESSFFNYDIIILIIILNRFIVFLFIYWQFYFLVNYHYWSFSDFFSFIFDFMWINFIIFLFGYWELYFLIEVFIDLFRFFFVYFWFELLGWDLLSAIVLILCLLSCELILSFFYLAIERFIFLIEVIIGLIQIFFSLFLILIKK